MYLADAQLTHRAYIVCSTAELFILPTPDYTSPLGRDSWLVEFELNVVSRVALRLCGFSIPENLGGINE